MNQAAFDWVARGSRRILSRPMSQLETVKLEAAKKYLTSSDSEIQDRAHSTFRSLAPGGLAGWRRARASGLFGYHNWGRMDSGNDECHQQQRPNRWTGYS